VSNRKLRGLLGVDFTTFLIGAAMLTAFLRLFALRPILAGSLLGVPILTLLLLGLFTALMLKFVLYVVLPVALVILMVRALRKLRRPHAVAPPPPGAAQTY